MGNRQVLAITATSLMMFAGIGQAQVLPWGDASIGIGSWNMDVEGSITDDGETLDFSNDLGVEGKTTDFYTLSFSPNERGWIPHATAYSLKMKARGDENINRAVNFGGVAFNVNARVLTDAEIEEHVVNVFWQLNDSERVHWFAGLEVKSIDAEIVVRDDVSGDENREDVSITFPMVKVHNRWHLSESLKLDIGYSWISYEDSTISDLKFGISTMIGPVKLEGGYWRKDYDVEDEDDGYAFDTQFDGSLFSASVVF